jgi:hypothetical protein
MTDSDFLQFGQAIDALAPYLEDLVIVGGWAHRLMRLHLLASSSAASPLMTLDADIAAPQRLSSRGQSIRQLLLDHDFDEELSGSATPPKARYTLEAGNGFSVEFITPVLGGALRRDGSPGAIATIQGVSAERLRHVDLLLLAPWEVEVPVQQDGATSIEMAVQICNPVSYLAQKILILPARRLPKQGKDVLYIHDTMLMFGGAFDELRALWLTEIRRHLARKALRQVLDASEELFGVVADRSLHASQVAREAGRSLTATEIAAVCRRGLSEIFAA